MLGSVGGFGGTACCGRGVGCRRRLGLHKTAGRVLEVVGGLSQLILGQSERWAFERGRGL
jgi:hypothetical protein